MTDSRGLECCSFGVNTKVFKNLTNTSTDERMNLGLISHFKGTFRKRNLTAQCKEMTFLTLQIECEFLGDKV